VGVYTVMRKNSLTMNRRRLFNLLAVVLAIVVFRSSLLDWYHIPSDSMRPTLLNGDRVIVNKLAYRLLLPLTQIPLLDISPVGRGDIVVFSDKQTGRLMIKRVVARAGDTVAIDDNTLIVNGDPASYHRAHTGVDYELFSETIAGQVHQIRLENGAAPSMHTLPARTVPPGHVYVLGDSRHNSRDSRFLGSVPLSQLHGRAVAIAFSFNPDNHYFPRNDRFGQTLTDL